MTVIQIKRGVLSALKKYTPKSGELLFSTDTRQIWVGDGTTAGGVAVTPTTIEKYQTTTTAGTVFDLGYAFASADVYLNGALQIPDYSYSLSGTKITFASNIPIGTIIYAKGY